MSRWVHVRVDKCPTFAHDGERGRKKERKKERTITWFYLILACYKYVTIEYARVFIMYLMLYMVVKNSVANIVFLLFPENRI